MNRTKKGDIFEEMSLQILEKMREEGQLGYLKDYVRVRKKPGYYSHIRDKEIIFDLSIELWLPNSQKASIIYYVECKHYANRIPVNDIEEFHNKISQVSGVNAKAVFITNSILQESALKAADSYGMMVIQAETSTNYKIILHKSNVSKTDFNIPFHTNHEVVPDDILPIMKLVEKGIYSSFILPDDSHISFGINRLSKKDIEAVVDKEYNDLYEITVTSKSLTEYLKNKHGIEIEYFDDNNNWGYYDSEKNIIGINHLIKGSQRELFIISHEFGHFIMHQNLSIGQDQYERFLDPEFNFKTDRMQLKSPRDWIEWQANYFASVFTMNEQKLRIRLGMIQRKMSLREGVIYLDDQTENRSNFNEIISRLSSIFHVTKTSIIYRLSELDLLKDNSRTKSIGSLIAEYHSEFLI